MRLAFDCRAQLKSGSQRCGNDITAWQLICQAPRTNSMRAPSGFIP
jgi:hypothetical protein